MLALANVPRLAILRACQIVLFMVIPSGATRNEGPGATDPLMRDSSLTARDDSRSDHNQQMGPTERPAFQRHTKWITQGGAMWSPVVCFDWSC